MVRAKATALGASGWLEDLPLLVSGLEHDWGISVGRYFGGGTEAFVAEATLVDGTEAVVKVMMPVDDAGAARHEATTLRLASGEGCAQLLREDTDRGALLLERLGPPLSKLGLSIAQRHEVMCATLCRFWRPASGYGLPTGSEKAEWLIEFISLIWEELDRPCTTRAVDYAIECALMRIAAHDDERAVLVHGDVHQSNLLQSGDEFKLVDPDGLLAEAEYDMGILMREDPLELMSGDPRERSRWLAVRCQLDAEAIWEWGVVERVSTGLLATKIGQQPIGQEMLRAADHVAK